MSAKRAFSDDGQHSPDRYSDDFVSDDDKRAPKQKRVPTPRKNVGHQYYQDKYVGRGSGSLRGQGRGFRKGRGNGRGNSRASEPSDTKKHSDSITTRVLSASRNRINELRNQIEELKIKTRDLEQENKLIKSMQFRHEKTIRTFEDKENDLPTILDKHNNEIRALKEQNRRLKEKYDKSDRYLRDAEDELEKVKKKMNKYKEMCEDKELMERDELSRKLTKVEQEMEEKEARIKELQKHIEVLKKSHKHEVGVETAKQKEMRKQLEEMKEKNTQLEIQLKEKDRALDHQNIHSNLRQGRISRNTSPEGSLTLQSKRRTTSLTELTPRDKAKFYSDKQRAELYKHKELKEQERKKKLKEDKKKISSPKSPPPDISLSGSIQTLEDTEENIGWDKSEVPTSEKEDTNRGNKKWLHKQKKMLQKQQERQHIDSVVRENQEILKKREQQELQELEARDRNERELEEQDAKEKKNEEERMQNLKKEMMESDSFIQSESKKIELLKKLKVMDEMGSNVGDPFSKSSTVKVSIEQSNGFLENNDKHISKVHHKSLHAEAASTVNHKPLQADVTSTVNHKPLHVDAASTVHHKPPHGDITSTHLDHQKNKRQSSIDDSGGYKPSYGPTRPGINKPINKPPSAFDDDEPAFKITNTTTQQADKKPNLLESLFGPQANSTKNLPTKLLEENESFFITNKSPSLNGRTPAVTNSSFPWETTNSSLTKANKSTTDSEKKPTIFNGGNPTLIGGGDILNSGKIPSHQKRQQIMAYPAEHSVTTLDSFGDDIEEVVL